MRIGQAGQAKGQLGFGNELESEALAGALPIGQNSPQHPAFGLISELISGTTFTAPRALNRRTYAFRTRPSVMHGPFRPVSNGQFLTPPLQLSPNPNQMRWDPLELPSANHDFLDGLHTICGNGSPATQSGMAMHVYMARRSMEDRYFANADGEMLILPDKGKLSVLTELGHLDIGPGDLGLIPRGLKFRVDLRDENARGFVCENFGAPFRLPELGLIGSNGLANVADFEVPGAAYEIKDTPCTLVHKLGGQLWEAELGHSPLDVVAWRGNLLPYKFDMRRFVAVGTTTVDHPDPSIFCALTSPSDPVLGANAELMILPPRWLVSEHSFRPPGFHRNCVAEFLGIIEGKHDSKADGFAPGGFSLHNHWAAHGPDVDTFEAGRKMSSEPRKVESSLVFMIESRMPMQLSEFAASTPNLQNDYLDRWKGFQFEFAPR